MLRLLRLRQNALLRDADNSVTDVDDDVASESVRCCVTICSRTRREKAGHLQDMVISLLINTVVLRSQTEL